jgi:CRISPR/Cas system-associated protein Cas5 (RAMP superfamily)
MEGVRLVPKFEFPNEEKIPTALLDITKIGNKEWVFEVFSKRWTMSTLKEWEFREIARRLNGLDTFSAERISRIEYLVMSIVRIEDLATGEILDFYGTETKEILRHFLLNCEEFIISELFQAYLIGSNYARIEFEKRYSGLREKLIKEFGLLDVYKLDKETQAEPTKPQGKE